MALRWLSVAIVLAVTAAAAEEFKPDVNGVKLKIGERIIEPLRVVSPYRQEHIAGDLAIELLNNEAIARDGRTDQVKWTARAADGRVLEWLGAGSEAVLVQQWISVKNENRSEWH